MNDRVRVELKDGVADVRLTRADKMNALDDPMFDALVATGERLKTEPGLRAVVLSGEGRAFCAGLDMGSMAKMASGERGGDRLVRTPRTPGGANRAQQAVMVWREVPVPVIAAVHGVAFGGGFQLCLSADMRYVAPDARLAVLEIKWGLVPDMGAMVLLPGLIAQDLARELTYTGCIFDGAEAQRLGLATRVCADPLAEALATAREIAGKSPDAIRAAKRLFNVTAQADPKTMLAAESLEQGRLMGAPNQVEAVTANMEKRAPVFAEAAPPADLKAPSYAT